MMLPTHALVGMVLALPVALVAPEFAADALVAGLLGGAFPDLDMYAGHRRTLHFPVYYAAGALSALAAAALFPATVTVVAAMFLLAAAVHSLTDIFGGGLELRPWEGTSDRAVYSHFHGRWIPPRRWVAYDGSPGDFLLTAALAVPLLVTVEVPFRWVVLAAVTVAGVYTAVRRVLPTVAEILLDRFAPLLSDDFLGYVPERYRSPQSDSPPSSTGLRR